MLPELRTERLTFRRCRASDFDAMLSIYGRPEVARMVASWPLPPDEQLVRSRCQPFPTEDGIVGVVERDGLVVGSIGCAREFGGTFGLGYGFHPDYWGQGYATEIGMALVGAIFGRDDADRIAAGVWADNPASGRVLEKLGFQFVGSGFGWSKGRNASAEARQYELTRARWLERNALCIRSDRLEIRAFGASDLPALHAIAARRDVARMTASFAHPMSMEEIADWVLARQYDGRAGFCAGIFLHDGTLIGLTGLAPAGKSTMYALHPEHWGQGYATEAQRALLGWAFDRYPFDHVGATHFHDNPASGRVLSKLGFEKTGEAMGQSKARLEPEPVMEYRLTRTRFESLS